MIIFNNIEEVKTIGQIQPNSLIHADCLEAMKYIESKSIDMILCDLPYGTTACKWDTIIPFEPLWENYKRIIKDKGAIVLFGTEPFSSQLRLSNLNWYKYDWIWDKVTAIGHLVVKIRPMQQVELISVFGNQRIKYNPIMTARFKNKPRTFKKGIDQGNTVHLNHIQIRNYENKLDKKYPKNIIRISNAIRGKLHPTQKPVELCEYLIKTYTDEGDLVLDNCAGSGTTGIASRNLGRNFILIEKELEYYEIILKRLSGQVIQKSSKQNTYKDIEEILLF